MASTAADLSGDVHLAEAARSGQPKRRPETGHPPCRVGVGRHRGFARVLFFCVFLWSSFCFVCVFGLPETGIWMVCFGLVGERVEVLFGIFSN